MLELFLNTTTREWFDVAGNPLADGTPNLTYNTLEVVVIYLKKETPGAGELGVVPHEWVTDDNFSHYLAKLTVDSDYIHKLKGALSADIQAGTQATITVKFSNNTQLSEIAPGGVLRIFNADGETFEAVRYTSREKLENGNYLFTLAEGTALKNPFDSGATADCDQAPYCSAFYTPNQAIQQQLGGFLFALPIYSQRLREKFEYSNTSSVDIKGLELLFYTVDENGNEYPLQAFLLDTASLVGTLGSVSSEPEPTPQIKNEVAALVSSLLGKGLDVETQTDPNSGATQIRIRLSGGSAANSQWSEWISVGMSAEEIAALEQRIESNLRDYVQTELANKSW